MKIDGNKGVERVPGKSLLPPVVQNVQLHPPLVRAEVGRVVPVPPLVVIENGGIGNGEK